MKINVTNESKIRAALDSVNGKASAHTLCPWQVAALADRAENMLGARGLPKGKRAGVVCRYTPEGPTAGAYKWGTITTTIEIIRGSSGWFLTDCERATVYPQSKESFRLNVFFEQRDIIVAHAMRSIEAPASDALEGAA